MLLANGHPEARLYPLGMLMDEANFVTERENARIITDAQFIRNAASIFSKTAGSEFNKMVRRLNVETTLREDDQPLPQLGVDP